MVKNLAPSQETQFQSLGWEDPLEKEMATHSSILAWRIPWTEELSGLQSTGRKESEMTERLHFQFSFKIGRSSCGRNFWVSGLSSTTRAADLKNLFSKYGKVRPGEEAVSSCSMASVADPCPW